MLRYLFGILVELCRLLDQEHYDREEDGLVKTDELKPPLRSQT